MLHHYKYQQHTGDFDFPSSIFLSHVELTSLDLFVIYCINNNEYNVEMKKKDFLLDCWDTLIREITFVTFLAHKPQ